MVIDTFYTETTLWSFPVCIHVQWAHIRPCIPQFLPQIAHQLWHSVSGHNYLLFFLNTFDFRPISALFAYSLSRWFVTAVWWILASRKDECQFRIWLSATAPTIPCRRVVTLPNSISVSKSFKCAMTRWLTHLAACFNTIFYWLLNNLCFLITSSSTLAVCCFFLPYRNFLKLQRDLTRRWLPAPSGSSLWQYYRSVAQGQGKWPWELCSQRTRSL